ncbi:MAG: AraC family transcriptional regulator [Gammaproteobacteria bacterium]|nr:AraC family transcriptional regulator [Gammaproteobacteria bacterium]MBU1414194.1 AraC family transcriptional regulator [Gammaproteobacteria bacterium]
MLRSSFSTVPISFVRELLRGTRLDATRCDRLLQESGISPILLDEDGARVTTEQFATLYQRLARELDDELPGMFSRPARAGTFKFLCLTVMEARNVRTALYRFTRFFHITLDDIGFELSRQDALTRVALVPRLPSAAANTFAQEILLRLVHGVISWLAGKKMPLARIDLAFPRPAHAADYGALYPGPAYFGQPATALYFDTALLDGPIRQDQKSLAEFMKRAPGDWLFNSFPERLVSHGVREYLHAHLVAPTAIEEVAKAMHVSVRTLSRRLRDEETSFQAIKDELRRDVAIERLTKTDTPIAVIGAELGFDSPATFHRAFKAWTGSTPGAYR